MQHYPICSSVFSFKQKSEDYQAFLILCFLRLYNYAESGLSKRFSEHLKTTETGASKKRSQDYWRMRRWSSIPQSPTRKAVPCVDKINILGYWGVRWGPDGRGLSTCQIEPPLFHSLDLFFFKVNPQFSQRKLFYSWDQLSSFMFFDSYWIRPLF